MRLYNTKSASIPAFNTSTLRFLPHLNKENKMDFILEQGEAMVVEQVVAQIGPACPTELDDLQLSLVGGGIGDFIVG